MFGCLAFLISTVRFDDRTDELRRHSLHLVPDLLTGKGVALEPRGAEWCVIAPTAAELEPLQASQLAEFYGRSIVEGRAIPDGQEDGRRTELLTRREAMVRAAIGEVRSSHQYYSDEAFLGFIDELYQVNESENWTRALQNLRRLLPLDLLMTEALSQYGSVRLASITVPTQFEFRPGDNQASWLRAYEGRRALLLRLWERLVDQEADSSRLTQIMGTVPPPVDRVKIFVTVLPRSTYFDSLVQMFDEDGMLVASQSQRLVLRAENVVPSTEAPFTVGASVRLSEDFLGVRGVSQATVGLWYREANDGADHSRQPLAMLTDELVRIQGSLRFKEKPVRFVFCDEIVDLLFREQVRDSESFAKELALDMRMGWIDVVDGPDVGLVVPKCFYSVCPQPPDLSSLLKLQGMVGVVPFDDEAKGYALARGEFRSTSVWKGLTSMMMGRGVVFEGIGVNALARSFFGSLSDGQRQAARRGVALGRTSGRTEALLNGLFAFYGFEVLREGAVRDSDSGVFVPGRPVVQLTVGPSADLGFGLFSKGVPQFVGTEEQLVPYLASLGADWRQSLLELRRIQLDRSRFSLLSSNGLRYLTWLGSRYRSLDEGGGIDGIVASLGDRVDAKVKEAELARQRIEAIRRQVVPPVFGQ